MLKQAIAHKEDLNKLYLDNIFTEKMKFASTSTYKDFEIRFDENDWHKIQMVSIDKGKIIGYIEASINRDRDSISGMQFMNFSDKKKDVETFSFDCAELFIKLRKRFRKISFTCIIGNPAEAIYDEKLVASGIAQIAGIKKQHVRLTDGKYYDLKMYELFGK